MSASPLRNSKAVISSTKVNLSTSEVSVTQPVAPVSETSSHSSMVSSTGDSDSSTVKEYSVASPFPWIFRSFALSTVSSVLVEPVAPSSSSTVRPTE